MGEFASSKSGESSLDINKMEKMWRGLLTESEAAYVDLLKSGVAYREINGSLRSGKIPQESRHIDDALRKGVVLTEPFVGYRGLSKNIGDGDKIDTGYAFVMKDRKDAAQYGKFIYRVTIPAGTKVGVAESKSGRQEVILPRDSKMNYARHRDA